MSTIITKKCNRCGYRFTTSANGYIADPIGCPLVKCNRCGYLSHDKEKLEWIQRNDLEKRIAVAPRNPIYALFISLFGVTILFKLIGLLDKMDDQSGGKILIAMFITMVIVFILSLYLLYRASINSKQFVNRYISSIKRTRVPEYRALLEELGPVYDEDLPKGRTFSKQSREIIDEALEEKYESLSEFIPTMDESIRNC